MGNWDSTSVVDVKLDNAAKKVTYKATTTVMVGVSLKGDKFGDLALNGGLTKQVNMMIRYILLIINREKIALRLILVKWMRIIC